MVFNWLIFVRNFDSEDHNRAKLVCLNTKDNSVYLYSNSSLKIYVNTKKTALFNEKDYETILKDNAAKNNQCITKLI